MKKHINWLQYSISFIFIIIFIVSIFNYKIDSLGIFGNSNYLSQAAKALTSGKMIAGLKDYDERLLQELVIKNLEVKNDVIAIGSSKTMLLRKRFFLDNKINFFNHSVSGASLEDYIAVVGAYEKIHGYLPSSIILGIDPWVFNKNSGQKRWQTLSKYYDYEVNKIYNGKKEKSNNINITKWKQLVNYDYTISNIKFFKTLFKNKGKAFYITETIEIDDRITEIDGSIHYPYKQRHPKYEEVKESAIKSANKPVYSLERYNFFNNTKLFEDFIKYLQLNNVKIVFFLPPYNPFAYDRLIQNKDYKILTKVETYLKLFALKNNIEVKGSYNPYVYNLKNEDFFDGMHGNEGVVKNIFLKRIIK